jgi:hypothetical protein
MEGHKSTKEQMVRVMRFLKFLCGKKTWWVAKYYECKLSYSFTYTCFFGWCKSYISFYSGHSYFLPIMSNSYRRLITSNVSLETNLWYAVHAPLIKHMNGEENTCKRIFPYIN